MSLFFSKDYLYYITEIKENPRFAPYPYQIDMNTMQKLNFTDCIVCAKIQSVNVRKITSSNEMA